MVRANLKRLASLGGPEIQPSDSKLPSAKRPNRMTQESAGSERQIGHRSTLLTNYSGAGKSK